MLTANLSYNTIQMYRIGTHGMFTILLSLPSNSFMNEVEIHILLASSKASSLPYLLMGIKLMLSLNIVLCMCE